MASDRVSQAFIKTLNKGQPDAANGVLPAVMLLRSKDLGAWIAGIVFFRSFWL
ncbi:MAG: hypothetical protein H6540_03505 [Bacteroidales bacterium]|nr:hypothetical protein [Bacteroidales bacterium]